MTEEFSVFVKNQEEWEEVQKLGNDNGFNRPKWATEEFYDSAPYLHFSENEILDHNEASEVKNFTFEEFKQKYMNKDTFQVDKEFIEQAYSAANAEWRKKLEDKFPDVFKFSFKNAQIGDKYKHNDGSVYILSSFKNQYFLLDTESGEFYAPPDIKEKVAMGNDHYFTKL